VGFSLRRACSLTSGFCRAPFRAARAKLALLRPATWKSSKFHFSVIFGHLWSRLVIFRACLKMERGCVADQPQHLAIAKTPENSRPAAAGRGRPSRAPGFSDTLSPVPVPYRINLFNPYPKSLQ